MTMTMTDAAIGTQLEAPFYISATPPASRPRCSLKHGDTFAAAARFLRRREDEVRRKAVELGLQQGQSKWAPHPFLTA